MRGAVLYGPRDVRFEEREVPKITKPTDAIIRLSATCVCGSDLWPYRGIQPIAQPTPMGHEYCGVVEEVGREARNIKPGQFVAVCRQNTQSWQEPQGGCLFPKMFNSKRKVICASPARKPAGLIVARNAMVCRSLGLT